MTPRYLVIADYPQWSAFKYSKGDILELKGIHYVGGNTARPILESEINLYPHLFRLLHWWEYRDEKEMPEYVKIIDKSEIVKIHTVVKDVGFRFFDGNNWRHKAFSTNTIPSTESQYSNYINSKN